MNCLYICDTPYQVLNVLNIAFHQKNTHDESHKTLCIINQFKTAHELYKNILETHLFDEVYLLTRDETKFLKVGMKRNIRMALDFLNPDAFLMKRFQNCAVEKSMFRNYDRVYGSGAYSTIAAILKLNPHAEFILYDDGIGSYSGDIIVRSSGGRINRIFCELFHVGSAVCKPAQMLVNNPSFCECTSVNKDQIQKLPDLDKEFIAFCNPIFQIKKNDGSRAYWLTQPLDTNKGRNETRNVIKEILKNYKDKVIVRLHPRDDDYDFYSAFSTEDNKALWELSILNKHVEDLILISEYSSAQMTPKILFDLEPTLIFAYRLNRSYSMEQLSEMNARVDDFRKLYRQPSKIIVPDDEGDFAEVLTDILG